MFYCQHILGIGHLVRSLEIVRGLVSEFQVCFINGGAKIANFQPPRGIEIIDISAIETDPEFQELKPVDRSLSLEQVKEIRREKLLNIFAKFQPDILIVELFPFGRRRFSFELIPLLEKAKAAETKIVSSLRDILVTKQERQRHEEKVCRLINKYFDLLLIHGDPSLVKLEESFSRIQDLNCPVYYTGYVTQKLPKANQISIKKPLIVVSVGGGRFGHDLLECVVKTAPILEEKIPHYIQMFTGPFISEEIFERLQNLAAGKNNIAINVYTPDLLSYMQQADLSISMSGYNTTMNILNTGVKAMMMAFRGNGDREQEIRANKLEKLNRIKVIHAEDLQPEKFANKIITYLQEEPNQLQLDFTGVEKTAYYLRQLVQKPAVAV
ncbi:glycosyl transferase [Pleurocapsales cyanobacterium LEGE 06147]|nr:glycosyl transferase [Pleurocapsales cyanobacterium LEGE 06147]